MNKEEKEIVERLMKPAIPFDYFQVVMDRKARELGYKDHKDFLNLSGWSSRFDTK